MIKFTSVLTWLRWVRFPPALLLELFKLKAFPPLQANVRRTTQINPTRVSTQSILTVFIQLPSIMSPNRKVGCGPRQTALLAFHEHCSPPPVPQTRSPTCPQAHRWKIMTDSVGSPHVELCVRNWSIYLSTTQLRVSSRPLKELI